MIGSSIVFPRQPSLYIYGSRVDSPYRNWLNLFKFSFYLSLTGYRVLTFSILLSTALCSVPSCRTLDLKRRFIVIDSLHSLVKIGKRVVELELVLSTLSLTGLRDSFLCKFNFWQTCELGALAQLTIICSDQLEHIILHLIIDWQRTSKGWKSTKNGGEITTNYNYWLITTCMLRQRERLDFSQINCIGEINAK